MKPELVMTAYTGIMFCKDFSEYHKFVEDLLGTPIWTHEFANAEIVAEIKKAVEYEYRNGVFQLYAAAPQLLEACETMLDYIHATTFEEGPGLEWLEDIETVIRAAKEGDE